MEFACAAYSVALSQLIHQGKEEVDQWLARTGGTRLQALASTLGAWSASRRASPAKARRMARRSAGRPQAVLAGFQLSLQERSWWPVSR